MRGKLYSFQVQRILHELHWGERWLDTGFPEEVRKCLDQARAVLLEAALTDIEVEPIAAVDPIATIAAACAQPRPAPDLDAALVGMRALNAEAVE